MRPVTLDGSYGEGGGQILRTALALAAITGRQVALTQIRAGRANPGLRPQHLAVVRAMAAICQAELRGDAIGSRELTFAPQASVQAGDYVVDVAEMAGEGSAGAVTLLFQALFIPLALAGGPSTLTLRGGTHVRWSPPYHYLSDVFVPLAERIGLSARLELGAWGWFPRGGGEMVAHLPGGAHLGDLRALELTERGGLKGLWGFSAASNLPEHVAQRQRDQFVQRLSSRHQKAELELWAPPSPGPGTCIFLLAEYDAVSVGFTGYGRLRYPAEQVADDAFEEYDTHRRSGMALDPHLADQVLLPLALAKGLSRYTTSQVTAHLATVAWVAERMLGREIVVQGPQGGYGEVAVL